MLRVVSQGGLLLALLVFGAGYHGTLAGYEAIENGAGSPEAVGDDLQGVLETAQENATQNATAVQATYVESIISVVGTAVDGATSFGYHHPAAAEWYLRAAPATSAIGIVMYLFGTWRQFRKG